MHILTFSYPFVFLFAAWVVRGSSAKAVSHSFDSLVACFLDMLLRHGCENKTINLILVEESGDLY